MARRLHAASRHDHKNYITQHPKTSTPCREEHSSHAGCRMRTDQHISGTSGHISRLTCSCGSFRKQGKDTTFVCGSDAHGTPIVINAEELGVVPSELVQKYHDHFDETFKSLNIIFDKFGNTESEANHNRTTEIVNALIANGYVFSQSVKLAYCPTCDRFLPDRYVEGVCPDCSDVARAMSAIRDAASILSRYAKYTGAKQNTGRNSTFFFRLSVRSRRAICVSVSIK
ncbi:MAG: Methionine--tRNA ligase [Candidatus Methanogaster sp.]|nr:MAG: Methionine--tRNA ligase [ANME-2 cluster archaeon]